MDAKEETRAPLPWDTPVLEGWPKYAAAAGFVVAAAVMAASFLYGMAAVSRLLHGECSTPEEVLDKTIAVLLCAGALEAGYKFASYLYGKVTRPREETLCGDSAIYFLPASPLRTVRGQGQIEFRENGLELRGTLSPSNVPALVFFLAACAVSVPIVRAGHLGFLPVAAAGAWAIYYHAFGRKTSVVLSGEDVRAVRCQGPVVDVKLNRAPIRFVRMLRFFVNPSCRDEFFERFDMAFPRKLPAEYREAAEGLRSEAPAVVTEEGEGGWPQVRKV